MVLVASERTWTIGLCSICILHNTILARSWKSDRGKGPFYLSTKGFQKNYQFEDFFWTGSGDGPLTEDIFRNITGDETDIVQPTLYDTWKTTTVFHTTTILFATVYPNGFGCSENDCIPEVSPFSTESIDFSLPAFPSTKVPETKPTPGLNISISTAFSVPSHYSGLNVTVTMTVTEMGTSTITLPSSVPKPSTITVTVQTPIPSLPFTTIKPSTTNHFYYPNSDEPHDTNKLDESNASSTVFPEMFLDQKYWLLTILKNEKNYLPNLDVNATERKLSNLYSQAFNRREDKFGDDNDIRDRKSKQSVRAHIVNVTQVGADIGLVYTVTASGKPIPAMTAANDMRLMTPSEVMAELGRPILTKAEPYIKVTVPLGARVKRRARDTWLLIGCVIAAISILMLLVGLFALILSKKKNKKKSANVEEETGTTNLGFDADSENKSECPTKPPRASRLKPKNGNQKSESTIGTVKFKEDERRSLTSSSCSGSSEAGLVRFRTQQKKKDEKPKPKPRTRERRIQSSDFRHSNSRRSCITSAGSLVSKNTVNDSEEDYSPHVTRSPTSYLSMPSVKAFPRGTRIPDPMNKILEPTSIRHLDADSDSQRESSRRVHTHHVEVNVERHYDVKHKFAHGKGITRHASLEGDDPGVIGPVVWNKHCQKILDRDADVLNEIQYDNLNVGRMRRRFNELLDDALSMFGSSNGSPERNDLAPSKQPDNRVHSAILRPAGLRPSNTSACRPNTTGSKRPQSSTVSGPKGAWETPSCSTLARPLSAGFFHDNSPKIDKNLIYVNSELSPSDPAVPLIAAIKKELKKFDGTSCTSEKTE